MGEPMRDAEPRIVCTECPAVAKIHYWGPGGHHNYALWAECHGQHVYDLRYASGPDKAIESFTANGKLALFDQLHGQTIEQILKATENDLTNRSTEARAINVQVKYLQTTGKLPPIAFQAIAQLAEREMQFWGELAQKLGVSLGGKL